MLNVAAAADSLRLVDHGRTVEVAVRTCGSAGCRGDYVLGGRTHRGEEISGVGANRVGRTVDATVDGRRPGRAVTGGPVAALVEALVIAVAGAALAVLSGRAAVRRTRRAPRPAPAPSSSPDQDDPLGWVRKRRFGAGA